ncbi:histamine N-methyltransferase-like [Ptychodera flava]|uniref:histamine N-methyltransferase-like n=1 Tax=Ptychodera flava TaxID=63121 RepID=UPI00396A375A
MSKRVKILYHHPEEFFNRYSILMKYVSYYSEEDQQRSLNETFGNFKQKGDSLRVLAVGTGDGSADVPVIDILQSKQCNITYSVVEPMVAEVEKFKSLAASKQEQGQWTRVRFEFYQTTIENYLEESQTRVAEDNFDIIHTIHCAYTMSDPGGIFAGLFGRLERGGMLRNTIAAGPLEKLLAKAKEIHPVSRQCVGSASLRRMIQDRLPDVEINTIYKKIALLADECFKEESREGNMMLDFLTYTLDFRKSVSERVLSDFMEFMREECCYKRDGKLFLHKDEEDIVIFKK